MTLRKYFVYIDDGENVYRAAIPATSEERARKYCEGNGEIVAVKDVTDDYPISYNFLAETMKKSNIGKTEQDFILRALLDAEIITQDI